MSHTESLGIKEEILDLTQHVVLTEPNFKHIKEDISCYAYTWQPLVPEAFPTVIELPKVRLSRGIHDPRTSVVDVELMLTDMEIGMFVNRNDNLNFDADPFATDFLDALKGYSLHDHKICMAAYKAKLEAEAAARAAEGKGAMVAAGEAESFTVIDKRRNTFQV